MILSSVLALSALSSTALTLPTNRAQHVYLYISLDILNEHVCNLFLDD